MFQGSQNLGKMEFIRLVESNGGLLNGSTRFDFTNYFEVVPVAHAGDRSCGPRPTACAASQITQENLKNQQERRQERGQGQRAEPAVRRVPVDRPAAGAPTPTGTTRTTSTATSRTSTRRRSTTSSAFFKTFYAPNNAVLVVVGDFEPAQAQGLGREVLRRHPRAEAAAAARSRRAAAGEGEARRRAPTRSPTGPRSALGYHVPERSTPEWYAFGLLDQMLGQGHDSLLYEELVRKRGLTGERRRRHQLGPRQHVQLQRADALDRSDLSTTPAQAVR